MEGISVEDDFSLILDYFTKLFASKRMRRIYIRDIPVDYIGNIKKTDGGEVFSTEYPGNEGDIVAISLAVPGNSKSEAVSVTIYNNSARCSGCSRREMDDIISFLDSSTFRYF